MTNTIKEWLTEEQENESFLIKDIAKHGCAGGVSGLNLLQRN